jgi:hypothetical protein
VKKGKCFDLPESPADIEQLWRRASPLHASSLPEWIGPEDCADYRLVGVCRHDDGEEELHALEDAGLIVEPAAAGPGLRQVYMARPSWSEIWSIGLYGGSSPLGLSPWPGIVNPVLTRADVTDVPATYVADPFTLRVAGIWHLFFEVMNWRSGKGEIGLATSEEGLRWAYRQIVLAEPFHLSYPYVFQWEGDFFLIPESFQAGAVRLYRAQRFPTVWTPVATLLEGPYLADASVVRFAGRWWLFVETGGADRHDTLRLFFADELRGPWQEHPRSPIINGDPRRARPAGRILPCDGWLIRFAQGCQPSYGTDVRAFVITELTPTGYKERPAREKPVLGPGAGGWNAGGMHHVDACQLADGSWRACVDGWHRRQLD